LIKKEINKNNRNDNITMNVTSTISYYVLNLKYNKICKEFSFKTSLEKISSNPLHYMTTQISLIIYF